MKYEDKNKKYAGTRSDEAWQRVATHSCPGSRAARGGRQTRRETQREREREHATEAEEERHLALCLSLSPPLSLFSRSLTHSLTRSHTRSHTFPDKRAGTVRGSMRAQNGKITKALGGRTREQKAKKTKRAIRYRLCVLEPTEGIDSETDRAREGQCRANTRCETQLTAQRQANGNKCDNCDCRPPGR